MQVRIIELSHALTDAAPAGPVAPTFERSVHHDYQPFNAAEKVTDATILAMSDAISMGSHTGTHMDSLLHVGIGDSFHRGDPLPPFVGRAVLLDFPRLSGVDVVDSTTVIDSRMIHDGLQHVGVALNPGDALLLRMGWDTLVGDPEAYGGGAIPGVDPSAARLIGKYGVALTGADTIAFERVPSDQPLEVHAELLHRHGIPILENLDLRELSAAGVVEFELVVAPLRIVGGSASPVNPLAIVR